MPVSSQAPGANSYSFGGYKKDNCTHYGAKEVMKVGKKCRLWAGGRIDLLEEASQWDLIVSAVGYADFLKNPITGNKEALASLPESLFAWSPPPCVGIDWPDRGVPNLGPDWWKELAAALKGIDGNVGVCCQGGHGRTGTMLAILASLTGKVRKNKCPVAWVRKSYCHEAVESEAQGEYIEWVTGRKVTAKPSDSIHPTPAPVGGGSTDVNPTLPLGLPSPAQEAEKAAAAISTGSGVGGTGTDVLRYGDVLDDGTRYGVGVDLAPTREPSDAELEDALEAGDGQVTAWIAGTGGRRWSPVYGEDNKEIVGWCEEEDLSDMLSRQKKDYHW